MKEITRRLYTKPVMLGMALIVGVALVIGLFVTSKSTAAPSQFPVAAGNDEFETPGDGTTFHDFGGSPIPAGFFGTGSLAYSKLVPLQGVPLGPGSNVDTVIERASAVSGPGGSTGITMTALSLKASTPITVTYQNNSTETWDVFVGLSIFKTSGGTMTINASTFDSTLKVWPRFTFKRVPDGLTKVLDTGSGSGLTAQSADSGLAATESAAADVSDSAVVIEPAPLPAPCPVATVSDSRLSASMATTTAAASSCAPVQLSSVNQPWGPCAPNTFCITVPITEEERWARHRPKPKAQVQQGVAE
ncbi:MAG TPA: hypothetical protein VE980_00935 [Pyrinomonadaceae bacterium]|nr:hypothetical protein [Pyrinomonadaceae bacterium]